MGVVRSNLADRARRGVAGVAFLVAMLATGAGAKEKAEAERTQTIDRAELYALAPYVAQVLNLAQLDPVLAASLVPDRWIDSLATSALAVESETAVKSPGPDSAQAWPIGPWPDPDSLAASIRAVEPRAVASLYAALRPRFSKNCRRLGASLEACERALQATIARLAAPAVRARTHGADTAPITPTQLALARLGEPVVAAVHRRLRSLQRAVWGDGPPAATN